ncbi:MAG TPA: hypothetical protein VJG83_00770 [archaeon]|nr:hypothetical protein [archaeon]
MYGNEKTGLGAIMVAGIAIVSIIIGFAAATVLNGNDSSDPVGAQYGGFTDQDKNFLATIANSQIQVTSANVAAVVDWCQANGGVWNITQEAGQVVVSEQVAAQLQQQNVDVVQTQDGNWVANVAVLSRDTCIFPIGRGEQ